MKTRLRTLLLAAMLIGGAALPMVALADEHEDEADEPEENETEEEKATELSDEEEENETDERDDEEEENETERSDEEDEEAEEADDDADEADDGDDDEREEKRSVEVESDDEGIEIELKREDGSAEDKVEMSFEMEDATFELKYEQEANATEREQKLEATFQTLAEYRDTNNNSKYDPGEPIVSAWALGEDAEDVEADTLGDAEWARPSVQDITVDNKTGKEITVNASLGENGTFELRFLVFGDFVDLGNATLEPTSAKIDIGIDRYPYQANDTALTLFMETKSETSLEHEDDDEGEGVAAASELDGKNVTLRFTWLDEASVDGTDHPVGTTLLKEETELEREEGKVENETKREFALSYARGETIVHDPKASVEIASTEMAISPTPGWGVVAALGALGLSAILATRGRTGRR